MGRFLNWLFERKKRKERSAEFERRVTEELKILSEAMVKIYERIEESDKRTEVSLANVVEQLLQQNSEEAVSAKQLLNEYLYGANGDE